MWRRFFGGVLDGLLVMLTSAWVLPFMPVGADRDAASVPTALLAAGTLLTVVVVVVQWVLHGRLGWTVGRRLVGIRTLDVQTRRPIGLGRVLLRGLVVAAGVVFFFVGQYVVLLSSLFDGAGRNRGWHDKAARDEVLDVRAGLPGAPAAPAPPVSSDLPAPAAAPAEPGAVGGPATGAVPVWAAASARATPAEPPPTTASLVLAPLAQHRAGPDLDTRSIPLVPPAPSSAPPLPSTPPVPSSAPPAPAPEPADDPADEAEDVETTRRGLHAAPPGPVPPPPPRAPVTAAYLEISDGQRIVVTRTALVGRNPAAAAPGVQLVRVVDPTRSVSKTHLQIAVEPSGVWVADRGSTNGTVVTLPGGAQVICPVDHPVRLRVGSVVMFGDCVLRLVGTQA
ncbi:RDD family protein [Cellulomonas composti]|uniref:FHA domain-containing protein n=1 Tax=Cellulomonas composti TaxID=266130 RepID=A0A511J9Q8_9CELL|nr:RDD family protein [Cellulomonas composti]GEL94731.1 hypothetical protein CCO02nite_13890 [Cellulomonas composti]